LYSGYAPTSHIPSNSPAGAPSSYGNTTFATPPLNYNSNPNFNNYAYVDPQAILNEKFPPPPEPKIPEPTEPPAIIATANPPVANNSQPSGHWLDYLQEGIGWLGLAPGVGAVPDIVNAGIYTLRGNYKEAALSGLFAIPIIGDAASAGRKVAKAAGKVGDIIDTGKKADEAIDLTKKIINNKVPNEVTTIGEDITKIKGGVYVLKDGDDVVRSGRSKDLARRKQEHKLDPELRDYEFNPVHHTDDYATLRGLEQKVHDEFLPPLDKINPINPQNPNLQKYKKAAEYFLNQ
jgi:hypothetical protein